MNNPRNNRTGYIGYDGSGYADIEGTINGEPLIVWGDANWWVRSVLIRSTQASWRQAMGAKLWPTTP